MVISGTMSCRITGTLQGTVSEMGTKIDINSPATLTLDHVDVYFTINLEKDTNRHRPTIEVEYIVLILST